jgi:isoamylase
VTSHDGFSLHDLVSYNRKHNGHNGQGNDGDDHNLSWNCGIEGPTDDMNILELRRRQMRNFVATLMFSQGVPMLRGGDEIAVTQQGNNNTYCQDNELSWIDWNLDFSQQEMLDFTSKAIDLRHRLPVLRRRRFFQGRQIRSAPSTDIVWFNESGLEMTDADWSSPRGCVLGVQLIGKMLGEVDERGNPTRGTTVAILFNASHKSVEFTLPKCQPREYWRPLLDSYSPNSMEKKLRGGQIIDLIGHSIIALELHRVWPKFGS